MLKTLKGLAEYFEISLGDLLEGIVLHAFEGKSPFGAETIRRIEGLKQIYDMDYDARASHRFVEAEPDGDLAGIAVVSLPAKDVQASIHFYRDVLGLRPAPEHGEHFHFEVGGAYFVIREGIPEPVEGDSKHFPTVAFEVNDLNRAVERLHHHDVHLAHDIAGDNDCQWVLLHDPAGNLIELVQFSKT